MHYFQFNKIRHYFQFNKIMTSKINNTSKTKQSFKNFLIKGDIKYQLHWI